MFVLSSIPPISMSLLCVLVLHMGQTSFGEIAAADSQVKSVSELTVEDKSFIDQQIQKALANPRTEAPRALSNIDNLGPAALIYASRETAKLLFIPEEINQKFGFDPLLLQVLKNLRQSERLNPEVIAKLKVICGSGITLHENLAKLVLSLQEDMDRE
jgi:hypothetical protein